MRGAVLRLVCVVLAGAASAAELVVNGGFENGLLGFEAHDNAQVVAEAPHSGAACVRIEGTPERNSFVQQSVKIEGGQEVVLSVWVRSEGVPEGADCKAYWNLWQGERLIASAAPLPRVSGNTPWTRQAARVRLPAEANRVSLILQLHRAPGRVWFDDLSLAPVASAAEEARRAAQSAGQARQVSEAAAWSREAPELAPGVRFAARGEGLFLCNERLALHLAGPEGGFGLCGLVDLALGRAFVMPGFDRSLWRVELRPKSAFAHSAVVTHASEAPAAACSYAVEGNGPEVVLRLSWKGVPAEGEEGAVVDAEATVSLRAGDMARWRLRVAARKSGLGLWLVDFPRFPALAASGEDTASTDYLAIPMQQGWRWRDPRHTANWGEGWADYPGGGKSMQFEAYCPGDAGGGGLYLATEDPACCRKTALVSARGDAFSYAVRHYPPNMGNETAYEVPYPVVTGVFSGDWWDAARVYRRWALRQPWSAAGPVRGRSSVPDWLKRLGVWAQGDLPGQEYADMAAQAQRVISFQEDMGVPLAFHAYLWQRGAVHDRGYPFLLPPKPGAREFVQRLRDAGVRVIPYLNLYSADGAGPRFDAEGLRDLAMRTQRGGLYGDPAGLLPMCPAAPRWQGLLGEQFAGVLEALPVDGLYLDQLTGAPFLCFSEAHGHPCGGGNHFYDGMRRIALAAKNAVGPDRMVFGENISEGYNDVVDAQLPWTDLHPDRLLPLYQTVYADYTIRFGLFLGRPDLWGESAGFYSKVAWSFVIGQQPGWVMFGILSDFDKPAYAPQRAFLRDVAACRRAALEFLQDGEFLRPLDFGQPPIAVAWDEFSTARQGALPPVLNGVWRSPAGDIGVALANWTGAARQVTVTPQREWDLKGALRRRLCQAGSWDQAAPADPAGVVVDLPPHTAAVLELHGE